MNMTKDHDFINKIPGEVVFSVKSLSQLAHARMVSDILCHDFK